MTQRQNALWNCKNPHQGQQTKLLAVCSAGLLRSPTIAKEAILREFNARSCGCNDYALIQIDEVLIEWADVIVFAHNEHQERVTQLFPFVKEKEQYCFNIPDNFKYNDHELVKLINEQFELYKKELKP